MREEDLKIIITLHEWQNLSKAAAAMYISQPTLSKQLHRIEAELGAALVNRTNRGISFTKEGEYLASQAHSILALIEETKKNVRDMADQADENV